MSDNGGELDLRSLDDDELVKQMQDDLYDGLKPEVEEGVHILLERGWTPYRVLTEALVGGMTIVGVDFRDGILFVPEVLLAANAMKGGMAILRPLLVETGAPPSGKMVIGTVKGDIHDIGKNLVGMMMEGAGFEVIDLGINCDVDKYLNALERAQTRHSRHVGPAHDHHALHEGRDRHDEGEGHPRRLCRPGRRRAAERGLRRGRRCRRLLPRRCRGGRDREELCRPPPQPAHRRQRLSPWPQARTLLIACGALARETLAVIEASGLGHLDITCISALLHNRPERIAEAVRAKIHEHRAQYGRILVLYGDCGTGGGLDRVLAEEGVERIAGPHCYSFYAGESVFNALADAEPGTFYLTDFLARQFDTLVIEGLGIDRHPELLPMYFGNYRRLIYLAQTEDAELQAAAQAAAARLGLAYEYRFTGLGGLADFVRTAA